VPAKTESSMCSLLAPAAEGGGERRPAKPEAVMTMSLTPPRRELRGAAHLDLVPVQRGFAGAAG